MTKRKFSTAYSYDRKAVSSAAAFSFDPTLDQTVQSASEDTDINVIFAKFGKGIPVAGPISMPTWGVDFTSAPQDFQEAQNIIRDASESFALLPSDIREKFRNDPLEMLTFVSDDANIPQARLWGLVPTPPPTDGLPPKSNDAPGGDGDAS